MEKKRQILIVDDEQSLASALGVKFGKNGFDPTICHDGATAIEHLKQQKFAAVLLDILMPETDGYDVLRARPKSINQDTPVYVLTALGQEDKLERAKHMGATRCYVKSMHAIGDILKEIKADLQMSNE